MRPTFLLRAGSYTPKIKFLGPRPQHPGFHAPAVHPATPKDIISSSPFLSSLAQSSSLRAPADASSGYSGHRQVPASHENGGNGNGNHLSSTKADSTSGPISKKPADFENFWDAPAYLWTPKEVTEREIEAVMSGGATDIRSGP
ncbi:hypothetical protein JCM24511_04695 [Saitozyma sp. JCM 24511]|nr:hypothetical protein JCM24511_04695 [Saitozyma sp. JCM 24511]